MSRRAAGAVGSIGLFGGELAAACVVEALSTLTF
jgi:hypothetical protein